MGYLNLVDGFIYQDPVFRAKLDALTENDAYLKDNGWNNSTKTIFYQAAVPTGWTKDTTTNNKFLRVVNTSGGGTGGSLAPSTAITLAHSAHSIANAPDHSHDITHSHDLSSPSVLLQNPGGARPTIMSVSGTLYEANNAGATAGTKMTWRYGSEVITTGGAGQHTHGGNSTGSALTDITLAYSDVIIGSKDSGGGTYTDLTSEFGSGDIINYNPFVELAENDKYLYTRLMPTNSIVAFGQATAPLGWTKDTSTNDKFLRFVSGTGGGAGGSTAPSTPIVMTHTHSTTTDTGHTHTVAAHSHDLGTFGPGSYVTSLTDAASYIQADGSGNLRTSAKSGASSSQTVYNDESATDGASNTASNSSHSHTLSSSGNNWQLAYLDIIVAAKDSTGAPYAYEDVTSGVFGFKKLVSKQKLNKLAKNDEYLLFHTLEATSKAFFFMTSVPITWTKIVTQDDKALRIVSGSSGGTSGGGSQFLSVALPLAHTHPITSVSHSHSIGSHTHTLASETQSANVYTNSGGGNYLSAQGPINNSRMDVMTPGATGSALNRQSGTASGLESSTSVSHDHNGTSGSALTDITLAYVDVLYAEKD